METGDRYVRVYNRNLMIDGNRPQMEDNVCEQHDRKQRHPDNLRKLSLYQCKDEEIHDISIRHQVKREVNAHGNLLMRFHQILHDFDWRSWFRHNNHCIVNHRRVHRCIQRYVLEIGIFVFHGFGEYLFN
ncbi:hypothetical protein PBCV1_a220L [Paramecium bursaria Chlorella virus 1]|uniref:Uncharacterized protein n=1 Tax=Paramecium bursaria Chlorella virus 1 TaxID=10506 RepID=Q84540_PBCV1|nr:hypothetical protein PBCV1_a220L [Paramecium bursaria Chlorella virus 1]AAC96588.1 hypothetical protein [Paramecium bursaria Chlorella virus 1]